MNMPEEAEARQGRGKNIYDDFRFRRFSEDRCLSTGRGGFEKSGVLFMFSVFMFLFFIIIIVMLFFNKGVFLFCISSLRALQIQHFVLYNSGV